MKINLEIPKEIVEQVEIKKTIDTLTVVSIVDDYSRVVVNIAFGNDVINPKMLILWDGEAYDAIGQYTDTDIKKRILELI